MSSSDKQSERHVLTFHQACQLPPDLHHLHSSLEQSLKARSSWLNCALRGDEAVYWVSVGQLCNDWFLAALSHYEAVIDVIGSEEGVDTII